MRCGCPIFVVFLWSFHGGDKSYTVTGENRLIGSARDVVAATGDDVILPCQLEPVPSAVVMTVEWTRPDLKPSYVHVMQDGREVFSHKNPGYKHRTALLAEELPHGNVSLRLSKVKRDDQGSYRCFLPVLGCSLTVHLIVVSVSQPMISIQAPDEGKVVLRCDSRGWYPEPEVEWMDSEGHVLPAGPTERHTHTDGLYTVIRNVTVNEAKRLTCLVQLPKFNLRREEHIHVPGELLEAKVNRSGWTAGISAGIVILSGLICLFILRRRRKTKKTQKASQTLNDTEEYLEDINTQLTVNIKTDRAINDGITMDMVRDEATIVFFPPVGEDITTLPEGSAKATVQSEKTPLMKPEGSTGAVEEALEMNPVEASTSSLTSTKAGFLMIPLKMSRSTSLDECNATWPQNQKLKVPRRHTVTQVSGNSNAFCVSDSMTRSYRAPIQVSRKRGSFDFLVTLVENEPLTPVEEKAIFPWPQSDQCATCKHGRPRLQSSFN